MIVVLSKYAWVKPIKDKTARNVASAFSRIIDWAQPRLPVCVQIDRGEEFTGSAFQELLRRREIQFRVARNPDTKAAVVVRLNRTLRERIWCYFCHRNTKRYMDIVQKIVHAYNRTLHSGTRTRPIDVTLYNASTTASENLAKRAHYNYRRRATVMSKFKVGNLVRISRTENTFEKGYEKNFSEEVFKPTHNVLVLIVWTLYSLS